jgi:hypothetical protein
VCGVALVHTRRMVPDLSKLITYSTDRRPHRSIVTELASAGHVLKEERMFSLTEDAQQRFPFLELKQMDLEGRSMRRDHYVWAKDLKNMFGRESVMRNFVVDEKERFMRSGGCSLQNNAGSAGGNNSKCQDIAGSSDFDFDPNETSTISIAEAAKNAARAGALLSNGDSIMNGNAMSGSGNNLSSAERAISVFEAEQPPGGLPIPPRFRYDTKMENFAIPGSAVVGDILLLYRSEHFLADAQAVADVKLKSPAAS